MNPNSSKAARLRSRLASERQTLIRAELEVSRSRRKIRALEAKLGLDDPDRQVVFLPNEVFMEIGSHLKPGSRTLLHLASANKDLYEVLLPRLLESLDSRTLLDPRFATYRTVKIDIVAKYLKELHLTHRGNGAPGRDDTLHLEVKATLGACADNLRKLVVNVKSHRSFVAEYFPRYFPWRSTFVGLEHLELHEAPDRLPWKMAELCPNLRRLLITLNSLFIPGNMIDPRLWKDLADLEHLDELSLRPGDHEDHRFLVTFPKLVSKIHTFYPTHSASFLALTALPEFKPVVIKFCPYAPDDPPAAQRDDIWRAIASSDSIKSLQFDGASTDTIWAAGFPRNLVALSLQNLRPMSASGHLLTETAREQHLAELGSKIPATLQAAYIDFRLFEYPAPATPARERLIEELVFWQSVATKPIDLTPDRGQSRTPSRVLGAWMDKFDVDLQYNIQSVLGRFHSSGPMPESFVFGSFEGRDRKSNSSDWGSDDSDSSDDSDESDSSRESDESDSSGESHESDWD